ncbi:MAG: recombinase family protein [Thiohalobacteraceae bacterium]
MVITILGMVADMELTFIKDRQRAGIEAARAEGVCVVLGMSVSPNCRTPWSGRVCG